MKIGKKVYLAVDTGFRNIGIASYNAWKKEYTGTWVYSTGKNKTQYVAEDYAFRLQFLSDSLATIIGQEKPCCVVAEMPVGSSMSQRAAIQMAFAFANVVVTCQRLKVKLIMVNPRSVKQHVSSSKSVSKKDVIKFVKKLPSVPSWVLNGYTLNKLEHVADAIACLDFYLKGLRHE